MPTIELTPDNIADMATLTPEGQEKYVQLCHEHTEQLCLIRAQRLYLQEKLSRQWVDPEEYKQECDVLAEQVRQACNATDSIRRDFLRKYKV